MTHEPSHLARLLRAARESLGLSRQQLADQIGYTPGYVEKIERGEEPVREDYLNRAAPVLAPGVDVPDLLLWLRDDGLRRPVVSDWLRGWLELEKQASSIKWFEPLLVPGLLQVEGYARTLLDTEEQVRARLARQEVFRRDDPPRVVVVVAERVLHTRVGAPEVMAEQLAHLTEAAATLHVLPDAHQTRAAWDGSFVLAAVGDREYVYTDTPARGFTLETREIVSHVRQRWEEILSEAIPSKQSRETIMRAVERWKT